MSDSVQPSGLQPVRVLGPWDSPGKNTGVGSHSLPGDPSNPGIEPRSPALQADSLLSEPPRKPEAYKSLCDQTSSLSSHLGFPAAP